ncbi:MAG: 3-dehydroquinate synthase [Pseudomonadota bacterium]|nr:3-dehydroquinate synthase [Pseudomonadota bacterium]
MKKILFKIKDDAVPVLIGSDILKKINYLNYIRNKDVVIITNKTVANLYLKKVKNALKNFTVDSYVIPDGERFKNIETLKKIHNFLIKKNYDRQLTIIALGGGVIGDLSGFASDTFLRGVDLIHIPTTLLAQVDSSIGGKTGINHKNGKNLIGSFKHPNAIIIDTSFLSTLPKKQFISGLAEVVKYGIISNKPFLKWLNKNCSRILNYNEKDLLKIVSVSAREKISIVKKDEKEKNIRAFLNFGHTLGHAIESTKNYKGILHGEAISIGMVFAAAISVEKSTLTISDFNLITETIQNLNLPISLPKKVSINKIINHLNFDKKKKQGKNNFVLLKSIGKCFLTDRISPSFIKKMIQTFQH